jgi:hypothetical protein
MGSFMHLNSTVGCQILTLIFEFWFVERVSINKRKYKYQIWYLTPYCGLDVGKPTQPLQSVKGVDNTFDWSPKWVRTLPSLIYFLWDIYTDPLSIFFFQIYAPQVHSRVSNINFDIWILICGGGLYEYLMKYISRTAKFLPTWGVNNRYLPGSLTDLSAWMGLCRP